MAAAESVNPEEELSSVAGRLDSGTGPRAALCTDQLHAFGLSLDLGLLSEAHALNLALYGRVGAHKRVLRNHLALMHALRIPAKAKQLEEQLAAGSLGDRELQRLALAARKPQLSAAEYTEELRAFVREFGDDLAGWSELADVYQSRQHFEQAAYCCEEMLLLEPNNARTYQRLGELHFSLGGKEHLVLAAKHFAFVLGLSPECYRALKALELTARTLAPMKAEHAAEAQLIAQKLLAQRRVDAEAAYK